MAAHGGPNIVEDGLVLYLDAANKKSYPGSGTVWKDLSGQGNDGILVNGPTFNNANGGSIVFDGVNDYGVLGITSGLDGNNLTFSAIAKCDQNTQASLLFLFNRSGYLCVGNYTGNVSGPPNGESFSMVGVPFQGPSAKGGEYTYMDSKFHDFTFTRSNNTNILYVDGVEVARRTTTLTDFGNLYPIEIGQRITGAYFRQITTSSYKIYNRGLYPSEILQNYNATKSRYGL